MKLKSIIVAVLCICVFAATVQAGPECKTKCGDSAKPATKDAPATETAAKPSAAPAAPAEKAPAAPGAPAENAPELKLPPKLPDVAATVGKEVISGKDINEEIATATKQIQQQLALCPPEKRGMMAGFYQKQLDAGPEQLLNNEIFQKLLQAYMAEQKITATDEAIAEVKKEAADKAKQYGMTLEEMMAKQGITEEFFVEMAKTKVLSDKMTSQEKVKALVKAHPEYFNGTKVDASHILITCSPTTPTMDQKKAYEELKKIKADIEAGKITFAEAAKKHSSCGTKDEGGNLGEFTAEKMTPVFSIAAFALKPEEISSIIRTEFGFHIVKLIKRTDGTEKIDPEKLSKETEDFAKQILMAQVSEQIVGLGFDKLPIVINKPESKSESKPDSK